MRVSTDKERQEELRAIKRFKKKLTNNKELAREFLISIGAMTKKGKPARSYNQVCISQAGPSLRLSWLRSGSS
jgi:hypothetical protein